MGFEEDTETLLDRELAPDLEVLRRLKAGEGSDLFLARQKSLDRLVVVKVLTRDVSGDSIAKARFEREARAAASLAHPNAVAVYRFGWLRESLPFLIIQYVNGPSLEEKLASEGPLGDSEVRKLLAGLAGALAEAHRSGFVHREVSPSKVLWDRERDRYLLSDFGLAGLLPQREGGLPRLTQIGEVVGRSGYMSPEQLRGEDPTEGTDVYALGVLGYEALTGEGPFSTKRPQETLMATLKGIPRPVRTLKPDADANLANLLERCLEKDPGKRPSADYLARALSGEGGAVSQTMAGEPKEDVLNALIQRRLPRTVAITGAVGAGLLYFVDMLTDRGVVGQKVFLLALLSFFCSLTASGVVAWFHGAKGKQRIVAFEIGLLSVIGLVWIAIGVLIFLPS